MSSYYEYKKRRPNLSEPDPDDIRLLLVDCRFRPLKQTLAENLQTTDKKEIGRIPGIIGEAVLWLAQVYPEKLVHAFKAIAIAPNQLGEAVSLIIGDNELPVKNPHLLVRLSQAANQFLKREIPNPLRQQMERLIRRGHDIAHLAMV